ncbi:Hypothetical protein CGLY_00500 [Corynebacterium glyciniphilum AJ 3170]|uniref:Uncharacterized protein n=1 Tax=Corynebacterium glyciniphilum AJ 3170 TaxID=1404245 RepID=X5DHM8_9CORY|nr:hypothetical protein [Corynebacterium glyciniphilum]AHW62548.1 Hypothetical protein CGLY_00500 [Corynebacterium glyciniphilum AJ 3170]
MNHVIHIEQHLAEDGHAAGSVDQFLDRVLDELYDQGVEADYQATVSALEVVWTLNVNAGDRLDALIDACTFLRAALNAVGRSGGWMVREGGDGIVEVKISGER